MQYDIKKLDDLPILEVAAKLGIEVKRKKTLCFLHGERTPSLSFDTRQNIWKCFGCDKGGTVITLVMEKEQLDFQNACAWLDNTFLRGNAKIRGLNKKPKGVFTKLEIQSEEIEPDSELYEEIIDSISLSDKALIYLTKERALGENIITKHNIKSIENISTFYKNLRENFSVERLLNAGLLREKKETGEITNGWWQPGIVFPYYNYFGKISNLQLRPYINDKYGKYLFLDGIKKCMYNEILLKDLETGSKLYICEGVPDMLSLESMGFNAVGIPGATSFKDYWMDYLKRFNNYILLDNDDAGKKAGLKIEKKLQHRGINVIIQHLPSGYKDVNEMLVAEKRKENE